MKVEVTIPEIGESITEGVLVEWSRQSGDLVSAEEPLLVLETDKVTMAVNATEAGRLETMVEEGATVAVGQVVATIDVSAQPAAERAPSGVESTPPAAAAPVAADDLAPSVARLVAEHGLDPATIAGTGRDQRLTKEDVLRHLVASESAEAPPVPSPPPPTPPPRREAPAAGERQTRTTLSALRRRLATRLVEVQQRAAILTTFNEVDMSRVIDLRRTYRERFAAAHDIDLGFMSFFVRAAVAALKSLPRVNAFIEGDELVTNHYYDIGIAVSTEHGLVVPVVRDADRLSVAGLELEIARLATRARERTLAVDELTGAVFTISNGGVFGSMLSTPILNPPGSAILGMHAIEKRPVVLDDEVVVRPMMYLALSYDHRVIDGREAVTFLKRVKECIEDPERIVLEV